MSLPNAQADFIEALFSKDSQTDLVTPGGNIAIYSNNIFSSLIDTLATTYPLIKMLLGNDFFQMTAREYIRQYPSRSGNLHDYGKYFGDFLSEYQPVHDLMYLAEVADFEWACHVLYLAPDHPPFAIETLNNFAMEQHQDLRFILHPAAWLRKFHFPILKIIDLCLTNPDETLDLTTDEGVTLLVMRKELDLVLITLAADDFAFLHALNDNLTLSQALQSAQHINPSYQLEEKLPDFIKNKIIVDCYLSDTTETTHDHCDHNHHVDLQTD